MHSMPDPGMMVGTQKGHVKSLSSWDSQLSVGKPQEEAPANGFPEERGTTSCRVKKAFSMNDGAPAPDPKGLLTLWAGLELLNSFNRVRWNFQPQVLSLWLFNLCASAALFAKC